MPQASILHVDLDAFFVAVEQARDPSLRGRPVIVGGDPDGRGVVSTASYEARRYGIYSGMPLAWARRRCPQAVFLRGDFARYSEVSRGFHAILGDYTPLVEATGLDESYLDLRGRAPMASIPLHAAQEIRRRVWEELSITASVGIATCKTVAKVASDLAKPDGLQLVPPGQEAAFLAPLPVRRLPGIGPCAERKLERLGVRRIGQLAELPDRQLRTLFGRHGPLLRLRARGIDPTPVAAESAPPKSVSREGTFAHDVADATALRSVLRSYCESVGAELREAARRGRTVTLKLRYDDFTTITRSLTLVRPTHSDEVLFRAASGLLEKAMESASWRTVRLIGVGVSNLTADAVQLSLLASGANGPLAQETPLPRFERLEAVLDRVRRRFGWRCLQMGRTLFGRYTGAAGWDPGRRTGLASQMGLK